MNTLYSSNSMIVTPHTQTITLPHEIPLTASKPKQQKVEKYSRYYNNLLLFKVF